MGFKELYEAEKQRADDLERRLRLLEKPDPVKEAAATLPVIAAPQPKAFTPQETFDNETLYQAFKNRLLNEERAPLLAVLRSVPEIEVKEIREKIKMDTSNAKGRLAWLIAQGLMDNGRRPSEILSVLAESGMVTPQPRISEALKEMVELGFIVPADGSGRYRPVAGMKVNIIAA